MVKLNDVYKLTIESLDHSGRGVAHIKTFPIFVWNALDGEVVDVKITRSKRSFAEGVVLKYHETNIDRITPICPYYKECGGCDLMHMSYEKELSFKAEKIKEIMHKFARLDTSLIQPILSCNNITSYRNKVTFKVENKIGFYRKKTNHIIAVEKCIHAHPLINELLELLRESVVLQNVYEFVIRVSESTLETMLILKVNADIDEDYFIHTLETFVTTLVVFQDNRYSILIGNGHIREKIGNKMYVISADSFFQVNTKGAKKIYDKVLEFLEITEKDTILDLYCGTGTIGIYIADKAKEVCGIEKNKYAILDAYKNKKINQTSNIDFECKDAARVTMSDKMSKVIVDPPRAGLDPKTVDFLLNTRPKTIVYVSCDPVTLARDIALLRKRYKVKEIVPIDMFPRTQHVECVCLLEKKVRKVNVEKDILHATHL